jgi:hypothetical protein
MQPACRAGTNPVQGKPRAEQLPHREVLCRAGAVQSKSQIFAILCSKAKKFENIPVNSIQKWQRLAWLSEKTR